MEKKMENLKSLLYESKHWSFEEVKFIKDKINSANQVTVTTFWNEGEAVSVKVYSRFDEENKILRKAVFFGWYHLFLFEDGNEPKFYTWRTEKTRRKYATEHIAMYYDLDRYFNASSTINLVNIFEFNLEEWEYSEEAIRYVEKKLEEQNNG